METANDQRLLLTMNKTMQPVTNDENSGANNTCFFETFFQGWLVRQQNFLDKLVSTLAEIQSKPERELNALVCEVLNHYQQYYTAKAIVARFDVFMMFAPPWLGSFEHAFLWIAGFKPGLAFKLVKNSVQDLSDEQIERVDGLMMKTRAAERELNNETARVQELTAPPIAELVRMTLGRKRVNEEIKDGDDDPIQPLREVMEALVVENADLLRMTTMRKVVEILSPAQAVKFLVAAARLQVKIRMWGWASSAREKGRGANYIGS